MPGSECRCLEGDPAEQGAGSGSQGSTPSTCSGWAPSPSSSSLARAPGLHHAYSRHMAQATSVRVEGEGVTGE